MFRSARFLSPLLLSALLLMGSTAACAALRINEIMASNSSAVLALGVLDGTAVGGHDFVNTQGQYDDWIELYNDGRDPVDAAGAGEDRLVRGLGFRVGQQADVSVVEQRCRRRFDPVIEEPRLAPAVRPVGEPGIAGAGRPREPVVLEQVRLEIGVSDGAQRRTGVTRVERPRILPTA